MNVEKPKTQAAHSACDAKRKVEVAANWRSQAAAALCSGKYAPVVTNCRNCQSPDG